jgi:hypothetical protein
MTPEQWVIIGTIDAQGTLDVSGDLTWASNLPAPPAEIVVAAEEHPYELEVRIRAHGQEDAVLHREYISHDAASTDKAIKEVWDGMSAGTKSRMRLVGSDK